MLTAAETALSDLDHISTANEKQITLNAFLNIRIFCSTSDMFAQILYDVAHVFYPTLCSRAHIRHCLIGL